VGEEPAQDRVARLQRQGGAEQRPLVEVGGDEAEAAQVGEHHRELHACLRQGARPIDARGGGSLYSAPRRGWEGTHILRRLYDVGEEKLGQFAEELLSNPRVAEAFARALRKAVETKGRMDRNMQALLGLLNMPSRADLSRVVTKLEAIQGSLVNLNLKMDRLLATQARRRGGRRAQAPRADQPRE
jgi:hypothetical protein